MKEPNRIEEMIAEQLVKNEEETETNQSQLKKSLNQLTTIEEEQQKSTFELWRERVESGIKSHNKKTIKLGDKNSIYDEFTEKILLPTTSKREDFYSFSTTECIFDEIFEKGKAVCVTAAGGTGKSLLMLWFLIKTALEGKTVFYYQIEETADDLQRRLNALIFDFVDLKMEELKLKDTVVIDLKAQKKRKREVHDSIIDTVMKNLIIPNCQDLYISTDTYTSTVGWDIEIVKMKQNNCEFCVIDNSSNFFHANENSNNERSKEANRLVITAQNTGASVVIIHHTGNNKASRGASSFINSLRAEYLLTAVETLDKTKKQLTLTMNKSNNKITQADYNFIMQNKARCWYNSFNLKNYNYKLISIEQGSIDSSLLSKGKK